MIQHQPSPSDGHVPSNTQSIAHRTAWSNSNIDPSEVQFIVRDWLGLHRIRALDSHVDFESHHVGNLLEQAVEVAGDIRAGRRVTSIVELLPSLTKARILGLRAPVSSEVQKIPLLLKTLMAEAVAGTCCRVVMAANINRYVSELLTRPGHCSNLQGFLKHLDDGKMFGALHISIQGAPTGENIELTARQTRSGKLLLKGTARFITGDPAANELLGCALVQMRDELSGSYRPTLVCILLRPSKLEDSSRGQMQVVGSENSPYFLNVVFSTGVECEGFILGDVGDGELELLGWGTIANLDASVMACAAASTAFRALSLSESRDSSTLSHNVKLTDLQTRVEVLRTIVCALSKWSEFEPFELGALATAGLSDDEKNSIRADTASLIPFLLPMCRRFIQHEAHVILAQSEGFKDTLSEEGLSALGSSCEALTLSSIFDGYLDDNDLQACMKKVASPANETLESCFEHFRKLRDELSEVPRLKEIIKAWWKGCERLRMAGEKLRINLADGTSDADAAVFFEDYSRYFSALLGAYWFIQHARASAWILDHEADGQHNSASISITEANCESPQFYEGKINRVRHYVEYIVPQHCSSTLRS